MFLTDPCKEGKVMKLYLVQHGDALEKTANPDRPLSASGRAAVEAVGRMLSHAGITVPTIGHSGKTRARQTAELLAEAVDAGEPLQERKDLSPNDPVEIVRQTLRYAETDIMLVGHLPFMGKLASLLLTGDEYADVLAFQKGGVACLERQDEVRWHLAWMVVPELAGG